MDRSAWKNLHRWLDSASDEEIKVARGKLEREIHDFRDAEIRRVYRRAIKFMDEELMARGEVERLVQARGH